MKIFFLTLTGSIASGYASYYIVRGCFNVLLWLLNHELTVTQRNFVIKNGYLAFVAGVMVGMAVCRSFFKGLSPYKSNLMLNSILVTDYNTPM